MQAKSTLSLALAGAFSLGFAGRALSDSISAKPQNAAGEDLFTDGQIRTFRIEVADVALTALKRNERSYVVATLTEGTNVLREVGIRLKGMGSFQPLDQKPSFAVKFDRFRPDQTYLGLSRIMLNNSAQDPTFLAEWLSSQMFRDAGVPAARVTHAFVEFNGRKLGLYVVVEAMNKDFLRQHFQNTSGNLYEAYMADIDSRMEQDGGTDSSQADVRRLLQVCRISNPAERWGRLPEVLEVDRFIAYLVIEMFVAHTDGYVLNRNNYRLYHDPVTDRFTFLAHGLDWAFADTTAAVRPPWNSIVTKAVLQTPEGRRLYRERLGQLFTNVFPLDLISNSISTAMARLKAAARDSNEASQFEDFGVRMWDRVLARHRNVAEQLATPEPAPLRFASDGIAPLSGWRVVRESGKAAFGVTQSDVRPQLYLKAGGDECVTSWRLSVMLMAGKYRFVGQARCAQLDSGANGAGLRLSDDKWMSKLTGDAAWTQLEHAFEVATDGEDKELVCELRAKNGEVWFDVQSLRLVRAK